MSDLAFKKAPLSINGIMPYAVNAFLVKEDMNGGIEYSFAAPFLTNGQWEISSFIGDDSGQSSWNSPTLNVEVVGHQSLNANRTVNSLTFFPSYSINLAGHVLSINSGAILTGSLVLRNSIDTRANSISGGTITTPQDRYFFHIYGDGLSVSSVISGSGKEFIKSGPGLLRFYGSQPNTYTGTTYVHEGTLVLNKSPGAKAVGNIVVGDGRGVDTLRLDNSHQIDDSATVTLKGGSRAKHMTGQGVLLFNGANGIGLTEKIHTLQVDGQGVINFAGGTLARPNVLETTRVLLPTADDTLFIRNWIEYADYFLVSRAFAPNADALSRIWFEGWAEGAKLRDYNAGYWEIVPFAAPEPSTYGALLGIVGIAIVLWRRHTASV